MSNGFTTETYDLPTVEDFDTSFFQKIQSNFISNLNTNTQETDSVDIDVVVEQQPSNFEEFKDIQNITFETSPIAKFILNDEQISKYEATVDENGLHHIKVNRTVKDLTDEILQIDHKTLNSNDGYWISPELAKALNETANNESITILEVIHNPDNNFDAVITQDSQGNIRLSYSCTDDREQNDLIHDALVGVTGNTPFDFKNFSQKASAELTAEYCYQMVKKSRAEGNDVQLSMSGYSLGGSNCEYGYLSLYNNHEDTKDIVNGLNLLNPLHGALSSEEASVIKQANNFSLYANEMDFVHTINNYEDFKDVQQLYFASEYWKDGSDSLMSLAGNVSHQITNLNSADDYMKKVFDENGNLRKINEQGETPQAYSAEELYKMYFGYTFTNFFGLGHQAIDEYAPDFGCELVGDAEYLIGDALMGILDIPLSFLTQDYDSAGDVIDALANAGGNALGGTVTMATDALAFIVDIPGLLSYVPEGENFFLDALHNTGEFFNNIGDAIQEGGKNIASFIDDTVHNAADFIKDTGAAIYEDVLQPAGEFIYDNVLEPVGEFFSDPIGSIAGWFGW